ncbi:golgi alpha-mannosidase II [Wolffia australiana]
MPFFPGNRRGGVGQPILPATSRHGRPSRKLSNPPSSSFASSSSRRRGARLNDLLRPTNSAIFAIALFLSLFFFIAFLRLGAPTHHHHPRDGALPATKSRSLIPRRSSSRRPGTPPSAVDITTKDLYDRIEFLDVDGGAWKQGWDVRYDGHEWDEEKLKVFVVPHSHNDPGWKRTVEEYYESQSRHILDTIVESLSKDERRKFIWEEISYLERWWRDASSRKRESFTRLVKNGQLEIVGGGWVMNDEANSHYFAIIEQVAEGNMWLFDTIGVIPKNSWSIDPFGYSATMAYLLKRMGFQNMLIQRTHYELKKELALHKNLEFIWRQAWDTEETTDIFVHMMPFYSYDIPHTCGPEPAVCCQFDFARTYGFGYERCPWGQHPLETTQENVQERALKLLDQYRKKSTLYRTNTLIVPLGDDFRYVSVGEAEAQFRNYQLLFDYINSNPGLKAEVKFGTLNDYFETLRTEAERVNYSRTVEVGSGELQGFPSLSGDFFTYADRQQDYWSGYYVSRPFFKAVDRVLEQTLRAAEMMLALVLGYCDSSPCSRLPTSFSHKLTAARRNLALFQHHDGVTGTATNHVVEDYGTRMHVALLDLQSFMAKAAELLLLGQTQRQKSEPQALSLLQPVQVRSQYDVQPVHRVLAMATNEVRSVVLFNPLEQDRDEVVMVVVDSPDVCVLHSNWSGGIPSQISPELEKHGDQGRVIVKDRHRLYWRAYVPALGLSTYHISLSHEGCQRVQPAKLKLASLSCPAASPYPCSELPKERGDELQLQNGHYTLSFNLKTGLINSLTLIGYSEKTQLSVGEEMGMYSSQGSGAYLFKPVGEAQSVVEGAGLVVVSEGILITELWSLPRTQWSKSPFSHSTRLYHAEGTLQEMYIEKEYHVELTGHEFNDKELICRFKTSVDSGEVFHTDLNGFQTSRRETYQKIPLQGNYYPMPALAFLQGSDGIRFSVHSRQALGAASLRSGWLEIMLDRRLVQDDGRGLGQGVMDNRPMNVVFFILPEKNVSAAAASSGSQPLQPSLLSHQVGAHLNYPAHLFVTRAAQLLISASSSSSSSSSSFAPLATPLPCDMHMVSLKVPRPLRYYQSQTEQRFVMVLQRRGWDGSYHHVCSPLGDEPLSLLDMFKELEVGSARATSLNLMLESAEMLGYTEQVDDAAMEGQALMSPMEIQAYKLDIKPRNVDQ